MYNLCVRGCVRSSVVVRVCTVCECVCVCPRYFVPAADVCSRGFGVPRDVSSMSMHAALGPSCPHLNVPLSLGEVEAALRRGVRGDIGAPSRFLGIVLHDPVLGHHCDGLLVDLLVALLLQLPDGTPRGERKC